MFANVVYRYYYNVLQVHAQKVNVLVLWKFYFSADLLPFQTKDTIVKIQGIMQQIKVMRCGVSL